MLGDLYEAKAQSDLTKTGNLRVKMKTNAKRGYNNVCLYVVSI